MTTHKNVTSDDRIHSHGNHYTMLEAIKSDFADKLPTFPPDGTVRSSLMWDIMQGINLLASFVLQLEGRKFRYVDPGFCL